MNKITLQPGIWTLMGKLSSILDFHTKGQESCRVSFGDSWPAGGSAYYVVQNHLPRPIMQPYQQDPNVYAMPDGGVTIDVVATFKTNDNHLGIYLQPGHGNLISGRVGTAYDSSEISLNPNDPTALPVDHMLTVVIGSGSLPPGLLLVRNPITFTYRVSGTPTIIGEFFFTLSARYKPDVATAYDLGTGELARGVYSIKVEAPV